MTAMRDSSNSSGQREWYRMKEVVRAGIAELAFVEGSGDSRTFDNEPL